MKTRFSIIGLGKLGCSMAAAIASRGIEVIGVDINQSTVELLNAGHAPVQETNLEEIIQENIMKFMKQIYMQSAVCCPASNSSASLNLRILPDPVRGHSLTRTQ